MSVVDRRLWDQGEVGELPPREEQLKARGGRDA